MNIAPTLEIKATATPAVLPRLKVAGNEIQNELGEVVVLHGVAIADPAARDRSLMRADFKTLVQDWGVNIVRVPIHPSLWQHDDRYAQKYLDPIVDWGAEYGFYVLLGYHAHGNPITNQVEDTPWADNDTWHSNPYNPDLDLAKSALSFMAERYKDKSNVIFGTFNEPGYIDWRDFRPVAEELVDVIHTADPQAVVLVSGMDWGYDLCGAIYDPVDRENVVYEIHPYPWSGEGWQETVIQLSQQAPVFIGEWGFSADISNPDEYATIQDYGLPLLQFADEYRLGWSAWIWDPIWTPSILDSWNKYTPTEFGEFVKQAINNEITLPESPPFLTPSPDLIAEYLTIYDDEILQDWDIGVWEGVFDPMAADVSSHGKYSISVQLNEYGSLNISTAQDISGYDYLEFYIYSGELGGQSLEIFIWDEAEEKVLARRSAPCLYPAEEWLVFRFPLEGVNLSHKPFILNIAARGSHTPPAFNIDEVRLVKLKTPEDQ